MENKTGIEQLNEFEPKGTVKPGLYIGNEGFGKVIPIIIKAIQELSAKVEALENA